MSLEDSMFQGAMVGRIRQGNRALAEANSEIDRANRIIPALEARIAELELALKVKEADGVACRAQLDAFKTAHPNSPMLADGGRRYKDGAVKTKGRLIWEAAFDKALKSLGISSPERYRE